jgi:hypothetical protein
MRRLSSAARIWLVIGCWALTLANLMAFSLLIR